MADNPNIRGPQDPKTVNVNQPHEVKYWTKKFNTSELQLRVAVKAVGTGAQEVENYFKK